MKHTPDIDVVWPIEVKHKIRVTSQWPTAQPRQVQFMCVAWRARCRMTADVSEGTLQRIDKTQGGMRRRLV